MTLNGRIDRKNFLIAILLFSLSYGLFAGVIDVVTSSDKMADDIIKIIFGILAIIIGFPIYIRRFHDLGRSGWLLLGTIIPFVNLFIIIYAIAGPGEADNKYGKKPNGKLEIKKTFFG